MEWIYLILLLLTVGGLYYWQFSFKKRDSHKLKLIAVQHELEARKKAKEQNTEKVS